MNPQSLQFLERWWLRGGLFLLPLAYSAGTYDSYVLPKLLTARIVVLGLVVFQVLHLLAERRLRLKRTSLDLPLAAFLVSAGISTVLAYNVNVAVFGTYSRYDGLLTTVTYLALFWLAVQALDGPDDARSLLRVLLASGYVVAWLAIAQSITAASTTGDFSAAYATLGNSNVAGIFLAMVTPVAVVELLGGTSWMARLLALNALFVIGVALALTLSRSAWLGAGAAALVLIAGWRHMAQRIALAAGVVLAGGLLLFAGLHPGGQGLEGSIEQRVVGAITPADWGSRPHIWRDTLSLIASRPLFGYGPDNFGLVYPDFQTGRWEVSNGFEVPIDKAHAETLQVAATQGLVGLAGYLLILGAFGRAFWRSSRNAAALAAVSAVVAYEVPLQLNFTALGSAFPFWCLAAAAVTIWENPAQRVVVLRPKAAYAIALPSAAAAVALTVVLVALPYVADSLLRAAVDADFEGRGDSARAAAAEATTLAPYQSVYWVEAGNLAFERSTWTDARSAYREAAGDGTFDARVLRNLALADNNLGLKTEALQAARQALRLDRFDPANRALVDELSSTSP